MSFQDLLGEEFEDGEEKPFQILTQIQIQCLRPSERKKYYKELAEKAKSKELPEMKSEQRFSFITYPIKHSIIFCLFSFRIKEEIEMPSTSNGSHSQLVEDQDHPK